MLVCMCMYTSVYTYMCICVHMCMRVHVCACMCVYVYVCFRFVEACQLAGLQTSKDLSLFTVPPVTVANDVV